MTRKIAVAILLGIVSLGVIGCSEKQEEVKGVEWYKAPENRQAFEEKLAWCRQHKEKQGVDQNCINAETASVLRGSFKKVTEPAIPDFTAPLKK